MFFLFRPPAFFWESGETFAGLRSGITFRPKEDPGMQVSFDHSPDRLPLRELPHGSWPELCILYIAYTLFQGCGKLESVPSISPGKTPYPLYHLFWVPGCSGDVCMLFV